MKLQLLHRMTMMLGKFNSRQLIKKSFVSRQGALNFSLTGASWSSCNKLFIKNSQLNIISVFIWGAFGSSDLVWLFIFLYATLPTPLTLEWTSSNSNSARSWDVNKLNVPGSESRSIYLHRIYAYLDSNLTQNLMFSTEPLRLVSGSPNKNP